MAASVTEPLIARYVFAVSGCHTAPQMAQEVRAHVGAGPVTHGLADLAQSWGRLAAELVPQVPELPGLIQQSVATLEGREITEETLDLAARAIAERVEQAGFSDQAAQLLRRMGRAMYELLLVIATQEELRAMGMLLSVAPARPAPAPPRPPAFPRAPMPDRSTHGSQAPAAPATPAAQPPSSAPAAGPAPTRSEPTTSQAQPQVASPTRAPLGPPPARPATAGGELAQPARPPIPAVIEPTPPPGPVAPGIAGGAAAVAPPRSPVAGPVVLPPSPSATGKPAPVSSAPVPPAAPAPRPAAAAPVSPTVLGTPAVPAAPAQPAAVAPLPPTVMGTPASSASIPPAAPAPQRGAATAQPPSPPAASASDPAPLTSASKLAPPGDAPAAAAPTAPEPRTVEPELVESTLWGFDPSAREPDEAPEAAGSGPEAPSEPALAVEATAAEPKSEDLPIIIPGSRALPGSWTVRLSPRMAKARDRKITSRQGELKPLIDGIIQQVHDQRRAVSDRGPARQAVHAAADTGPPADLTLAAAQLDDLLQAGQLERASALALRVTEAFPGEASAELACRAGEASRDAKQEDLAILCLTTAVLAAPPFEQACWQLAGMALERKDPKLAPVWLEYVARLLRVRGADEDAIVVYRQLINICPRRDDVREVLRSASLTGSLPD